MEKRTIVVKIGTNSLTSPDGTLNMEVMQGLVDQLAALSKKNNVLLVSSGAMGSGRSILQKPLEYDEVTNRQIYAVVGQVKLMNTYFDLFKKHDLHVAQVLATKQDFENPTHLVNTKNCIESLFQEGIIPIMNENDFVCIEELMFTDNDELAGMVSKLFFADTLVILSNVEGVFDEHGQVIPEFNYDTPLPDHISSSSKSLFGKGGMQSKFKIATSVATDGTEVYIASSKTPEVLIKIAAGEKIGTRFIPKKSDE